MISGVGSISPMLGDRGGGNVEKEKGKKRIASVFCACPPLQASFTWPELVRVSQFLHSDMGMDGYQGRRVFA